MHINGYGFNAMLSLLVAADQRCPAIIGQAHLLYHARFVATEACRQAANCGEFLGRVRAATGLDLEIIPTGEEARLALAGCTPLLEPRLPHALVFDIGGGSTEILWLVVLAIAIAAFVYFRIQRRRARR